jgi:hypothetical protein
LKRVKNYTYNSKALLAYAFGCRRPLLLLAFYRWARLDTLARLFLLDVRGLAELPLYLCGFSFSNDRKIEAYLTLQATLPIASRIRLLFVLR